MARRIDGAVLMSGTYAYAQTVIPNEKMDFYDSISFQIIYANTTPSAIVVASSNITAAGVFTSAAHGMSTGLKGQFTTSGSLPTGLSASTNYYIIALSANTFTVASSLANAIAGTPVTITSAGTGNQTFTATAIAGAIITPQLSNDGVNWWSETNGVVTYSTDGNSFYSPTYKARWARFSLAITSGQIAISVVDNGEVSGAMP
jgi:hypothetical protein